MVSCQWFQKKRSKNLKKLHKITNNNSRSTKRSITTEFFITDTANDFTIHPKFLSLTSSINRVLLSVPEIK